MQNGVHINSGAVSLPSRERGLKFCKYLLSCKDLIVAPFAGAWIEISGALLFQTPSLSLPSRERGLKSPKTPQKPGKPEVAPFAGAWIEMTSNTTKTLETFKSLPSRERGLKLF